MSRPLRAVPTTFTRFPPSPFKRVVYKKDAGGLEHHWTQVQRRCHSSSPDTSKLMSELRHALQDPDASRRLSAHLSSSTARGLSSALKQVRKSCPIHPQTVVRVNQRDLRKIMLQHGLPFIAFGLLDNAIMIIAGDYIDLKLGASLGISSMAAAGIGNTISDVAGLGLGGVVEDFCARLGLPIPDLTSQQLMQKEVRLAKMFGSGVGVVIGCVIGMAPLLFLETREDQENSIVE